MGLDKHAWNSWENYQDVHRRYIESYLDHFILKDDLAPSLTPDAAEWDGVLYCVDGLEIHVRKLQDVSHETGRPMVRTRTYSYHVLRRVGPVFDEHGNQTGAAEHVGVEGWPTLGEVIDQVHDWWVEHRASQNPRP